MDTRDLHRVDLNLLISLHVLLEERSVSRAAQRLFITQPAMSKTLARLRDLFGDALFTRSSHGMQPTPRALEIAEGLEQVLGDISQILGGGQFDPASYEGDVTLCLSEQVGIAILPALMKKLSNEAPGLNINIETRLEHQLEDLAVGNLDLAIQVKQMQYSEEYRVEPLGSSPLTIIVREDHELARAPATWDKLSRLPLLKLYVPDRVRLEAEQRASSVRPLVEHPGGVLEISALLTALAILRHTDYFMPSPAYLLQLGKASDGLVGVAMPKGGEMTIEYVMVAHQRTANSPLHNWLWELIKGTIAELADPPKRPRKKTRRKSRKQA